MLQNFDEIKRIVFNIFFEISTILFFLSLESGLLLEITTWRQWKARKWTLRLLTFWGIFFLVNVRSEENSRDRSSHRRCSLKTGVVKNFSKLTEKHLCWRFSFNKVGGLRPVNLLKKTPLQVFSCEPLRASF